MLSEQIRSCHQSALSHSFLRSDVCFCVVLIIYFNILMVKQEANRVINQDEIVQFNSAVIAARG
jgi:hypothetical protein